MASRFFLFLAGLTVSIGSVLFWDPVLAISQKSPDTTSEYLSSISIYAYLIVLIPISFYVNLLLLLLHVTLHDRVPRAPFLLFVMKYFPSAAQTVTFATLVFSATVFVHATLSKEGIGFAIGAALVCISLSIIPSSVFKKFLNSGNLTPALFTLCISTGFILSFIPFSPNYSYDSLTNHILIHLSLLFVSFVTITLSITLILLRIGAPSGGRAEDFIIAALSVAIVTLFIGGCLKVSVDMAAVLVAKAGEL